MTRAPVDSGRRRALKRVLLGRSGYPTANTELRRQARRLLDAEGAKRAIKLVGDYLAVKDVSAAGAEEE